MSTNRVSAEEVVAKLGMTLNMGDCIPTAGILVVRSLYPTNEVGLSIGTSSTQSWIDNIGLIRAAEMVIQNEMLIHTLTEESE